ncbi:translation initiation factor eIF-2B [Patescibacteria group bacterium]|nr:translation initiation factor eIF-2B [Patescibacteria group bacterium]
MTQTFDEQFSKLFREIEIDLGATSLSILVLESLYKAVQGLKGQDHHHFFEQFQELTQNIESTEPKYAIIIDSFYHILRLAYVEEVIHPEQGWPLGKKKFLEQLESMIKEKKEEKQKIVKQSEKINFSGKNILLYHHSGTVEAVLAAAKKKRKKFNVIVAEQDPDKTGETIAFLHNKKIPFRVVPSHTISHIMDEIDMLFMGALTLKSSNDFVMDTGSNGLVLQFDHAKKPIYVFISTKKFSLWKSEKRSEVFTHTSQRQLHEKAISFERIKFSHDRVEMDLFTKIITEEGIFTPEQLKKFYDERLEERIKLEKRIELLR